MPRTKLKIAVSKRNRDTTNYKLANNLKEAEEIYQKGLDAMELEYQQNLSTIQSILHIMISKIPKKFLSLRFMELKESDCKTFSEMLSQVASQSKNTTASTVSNVSAISKNSRTDEGYVTEESTHSNKCLPTPSLGPLSSAKAKSRARRSKSANGIFNNQSQHNSIIMNNSILKNQSLFMSSKSARHMIPILENSTNSHRISRSKFRTPSHRVKAASADRLGPVTPKVDQNKPVAILRYPKIGETVISLSGSPVIVSNITESTANVNIPMENGVLCVRPTQMNVFSPSILNQIDQSTFVHLKQLQQNLNTIMNYAAYKKY